MSSSAPSNQSTSALLSAVASAPRIPLLLSLLVSVPSAVLYIAEAAIIVHGFRKQFNSSFFRLFLVEAVANLLSCVGSFLCQKFGRLGLFLSLYVRLPSPVLAFFYFLFLYPYILGNAGTAALLLNRLTAIALPVSHEQLWEKALPWTCAVVFALPLTVTYQVLLTHVYVRLQDDGTYTLYFDKRPSEWDISAISALSALSFCAICLVLNLGTLVAYRQKGSGGQSLGTQSGEQQRKTENKLTQYAVCTFASQLFNALYLVLLYLVVNCSAQWPNGQLLFLAVFNQLPLVNDLSAVAVPAWLLLWASLPVRQRVLALARKAKLSLFPGGTQTSSAVASHAPRVAWSRNIEG